MTHRLTIGKIILYVRYLFRWMFDSKDIDFHAQGSHYSLVGGNLVISKPIKSEHVGKYSCLASNRHGTVTSRSASVQFGCKWPICEADL